MGKKLHGYAALREFIERLPVQCAHFRMVERKSHDGLSYMHSSYEGCPFDEHKLLHVVGAPDPLGLEPGKAYDLRYAGNAGGPQSRIFEEYQLRPGHKVIRKKDKDEDGKERDIGWEHTFHSIWFFKSVPGSGNRGKTFYVTAPYRVLGLSAQQPVSIIAPKPTPAKLAPKNPKLLERQRRSQQRFLSSSPTPLRHKRTRFSIKTPQRSNQGARNQTQIGGAERLSRLPFLDGTEHWTVFPSFGCSFPPCRWPSTPNLVLRSDCRACRSPSALRPREHCRPMARERNVGLIKSVLDAVLEPLPRSSNHNKYRNRGCAIARSDPSRSLFHLGRNRVLVCCFSRDIHMRPESVLSIECHTAVEGRP